MVKKAIFLTFILSLVIFLASTASFAGGGGHSKDGEAKGKGEEEAPKAVTISEDDPVPLTDEKIEIYIERVLTTQNYKLQEKAIHKLVLTGNNVLPFLLKELKKNKLTQEEKLRLIYVIGRMGEKSRAAVFPLARMLRQKEYKDNRDIRIAVLSALSRIGKAAESAVPIVYRVMLLEDDKKVKQIAKRTLQDIDSKEAKQLLKKYQEHYEELEE